ncbi:Delta 8-(E)-sphingolipid desaturase [Colletotrichum tropicale]|nr:Delta 8-(E)-sphingolipid desaturase [Colletotrichum tropicale]
MDSYHPGGAKSILHMIGRDATDDLTALHSIEAKQRMSHYRIGTIQGRWENFVLPIQGGTFRGHSDSGQDAYHHADTASSPASSRRSSVPDSDNSDRVSSMHRKSRTTSNVSRSSSFSSVPSTCTDDDAMAHLDFVTKQKISLDLETDATFLNVPSDGVENTTMMNLTACFQGELQPRFRKSVLQLAERERTRVPINRSYAISDVTDGKFVGIDLLRSFDLPVSNSSLNI